MIVPLALASPNRYRPACSPPSEYPLIVTVFPTPTDLVANAPAPVPTRLTSSSDSTPTSTGVPVRAATVVPSYSFDAAPNPLNVNAFLANCTVKVPVPVPAALRALTTTENVPTCPAVPLITPVTGSKSNPPGNPVAPYSTMERPSVSIRPLTALPYSPFNAPADTTGGSSGGSPLAKISACCAPALKLPTTNPARISPRTDATGFRRSTVVPSPN